MAEKLILKCGLSPGDIVTMTAAVRDLHAAHPGRFLTDVRTPCPALWENNPHITRIEDADPEARGIPMEYPLIQQSNGRAWHFLDGYREWLAEKLGVAIPRGPLKGDIHLSAEERGWMSQVEEMARKAPCYQCKRTDGAKYRYRRMSATPVLEGVICEDCWKRFEDVHQWDYVKCERFWIIVSGGKRDFTNKIWDVERWQAVVNNFRESDQPLLFVQVGEKGHDHPALDGVLDLRGKTDLRQLVRLMYHADGVICGVTSLMHLAAAVPWKHGNGLRPCVVVAGGREPVQWEAYPGHQFLHTIGQLPCCATGGCWKSRVVPLGDGEKHDGSLCERPVLSNLKDEGGITKEAYIPACLDRITAADVIRAVEGYLAPVPPKREVAAPAGAKPCCGGGAAKADAADPKVWGPRKWRELHESEPPANVAVWVAKFIAGLACPDCQAHFAEVVEKLPPDATSAEAWRRWGVRAHNAVNARLGKPVLDEAEALRLIEAAGAARAALAEREAICHGCEHYEAPNAHRGPLCRLDGEKLKARWRDVAKRCPDGKWVGPTTGELPAGTDSVFGVARPDITGHALGVVIGTYAALPYVHLQLESLRRFHPGTPCLVVDDGSPQREALAALCARYGADFIGREQRMGHVPGDMQVFIDGHEWARKRGVGLLVKFSRRWVPIAPWADDLLALWRESGAPTLCNRCTGHGFGFRSECVAMDVRAWDSPEVMRPLVDNIARARAEVEPGVFAWQQRIFLVEGIVHESAMHAARRGGILWREWERARPPLPGCEHYARWPLMGESRRSRQPGYLWHEWAIPGEYQYHLAMWGHHYPPEAMVDAAGNIK